MLREHADLFIAESDARVHHICPFERELRYVRGRGGTDLRPILEPELLAEYRVNGMVYFTGGEEP